MADEEPKHGVRSAAYSGGPGTPYYQPQFVCLCGWAVREETWEEAGREFDEHLAENEE